MIQSVTDVTASVELLVNQAADEFADALARGEHPSIIEFAARYPQIAKLLRQVLPTIEAIGSLSAEGVAVDATTEPKTLGDFLIEREIGRGGMGVVYAAKQISLGRTVALKVLPFAGVLDEKQLQRFKNEARAAATLEHPHIVPVYSVGCERGIHYFAMRFIDGQSLAELLQAIPGYRATETEAPPSPSALASQLANRLASSAGNPVEDHPERSPDFESSEKTGTVPADPADLRKSSENSAIAPASSPLETRLEIQGLISTDAKFDGPFYLKNVAKLGIQAAEALAYAHEQGILHRDIKPGNLLLDESGHLWVADFGLARLEQDASLTITGDMLGTLRYMSPEQALGRRVLDERSDVYSLGVTLYELLVLRPAFSGRDRQEILRRIASEDPTAPRHINPRIPRDLETIVLKAISKEPGGRYQTAQQLADDLRHYSEDQPIQARRPKLLERAAKWSRRHPAAVWATILVLLATTIVSAVSAALIINSFNDEAASRKQAEENEAKARTSANQALASARRATAIQTYLVDAFRSPDPGRKGRTITVAELLDRSVKQIPERFAGEPLTEAALLQAIGQSYVGLGLYGESIPVYRKAYDLRKHAPDVPFVDLVQSTESLAMICTVTRQNADAIRFGEELLNLVKPKLGTSHKSTLNAMGNLALAYTAAGRFDVALKLQQETLELKKTVLGPEDPDTLKTSHNVASALQDVGRLQDALRLMEATCNLQKAKFGADDANTLSSMRSLAELYIRLARFDDAIPLAETVRDVDRRRLGPNHPETLRSLQDLSEAYDGAGRPNDSVAVAEEILKIRRANPNSLVTETLDSMNNLAIAYHAAGQTDKAISLYEEAFKTAKASLPADDTDMPVFTSNLGEAYRRVGRVHEALPLLEDAVRVTKSRLGSDNPETIDYANNLALAYLDSGRLSEALPMLEEILELRKIKLPPDHPDTLGSMSNLADAYRRAGRSGEAIPLLEDAIRRARAKLGPDHPDTLDKMHNLAHAYLDADQLDKAIPLFEETLKLRRAKQGPDHPETLGTMSALGEAYVRGGRIGEAIPLSEEALKLETAKLGPQHEDTLATTDSLAKAYVIIGRPGDAVPLLENALKLREAKLGKENDDSLEPMSDLAEAYLGAAQLTEAETLARELLGIREKKFPDDWRTFHTRFVLGIVLLAQSKSDAAEPLLLSGYEGMTARAEKMPERSKASMENLTKVVVKLYEAADQPKKAAEWKAKLTPQAKK